MVKLTPAVIRSEKLHGSNSKKKSHYAAETVIPQQNPTITRYVEHGTRILNFQSHNHTVTIKLITEKPLKNHAKASIT